MAGPGLFATSSQPRVLFAQSIFSVRCGEHLWGYWSFCKGWGRNHGTLGYRAWQKSQPIFQIRDEEDDRENGGCEAVGERRGRGAMCCRRDLVQVAPRCKEGRLTRWWWFRRLRVLNYRATAEHRLHSLDSCWWIGCFVGAPHQKEKFPALPALFFP